MSYQLPFFKDALLIHYMSEQEVSKSGEKGRQYKIKALEPAVYYVEK